MKVNPPRVAHHDTRHPIVRVRCRRRPPHCPLPFGGERLGCNPEKPSATEPERRRWYAARCERWLRTHAANGSSASLLPPPKGFHDRSKRVYRSESKAAKPVPRFTSRWAGGNREFFESVR